MAYQTPKTDWTNADAPVGSDLNRIEGNIADINSTVTTGKNAIAASITAMGQSAAGSETMASLALKIRDISDDADATTSDVYPGKTFYQGGSKKTGNMVSKVGSNTVITPSASDQVIPQGYYGGSAADGKVAGAVLKHFAQGTVVGDSNGVMVVTGLTFLPSVILLRNSAGYAFVLYEAYADATSFVTRTGASTIVSVALDGTNNYVTSSGFKLTNAYHGATTYKYVAIE